uniref:Putative ribonuclease H-like domain-containing protein n=1 Tax=Tanacetum cinerariifolium TaxID=118510 RepID=A0A6L2LZW5_TANCI|nr:putative ribonuclease H-like domain-containing protein [Tanacetum cinerariifolium]
MEVKDLRLVESEEGKWTKVRWQLRKDKVVSVDKEESMVVESVRSSEQLVRWRVVRWRNGVAVSQSFADDESFDLPLIYHLNGHSLHYGSRHFYLVTGFKFGLISLPKHRNGDIPFHNRLFPEKIGYDVKIIDVLAFIEDEDKFSKVSDEDAIRLCLLLSLEVIFMGRELISVVDDAFFRMVNYLDAWNSFPWDEHIWRQLYDSIRNVCSKHKLEHLAELRKNPNHVSSYTLSGFLFSFKTLSSQTKFSLSGFGFYPRLLTLYISLRDKDLQESKDPQMVVFAAKLPILNPNEFDLWKMRIEQLARKNELKDRGTLLMALPDKHQLKFNIHKDAKSLMEAIEKMFGGNKETKKVQKTFLKQQYENFTGSSSESLDQIHDRLQKLISQLEILGESLSQEDINLKLLRTLPTEWGTHTLIWRNKIDFTNESVRAVTSVSAASTKVPVFALPNMDTLSDAVIFSFFSSQSNSLQIDNDDLKQIDADDLEEMDLKWQMAMLTMRAMRFLQRTGRNLGANETTFIGFDMSKVECYNCHRGGHFIRECRSPRDARNKDTQRRNVPVETSTTNALVSQCDGLESVEARIVVYQQNETLFEEDIKLLKLDVMLRDNALVDLRKKFEKAEQERDDDELISSKFDASMPTSQVYDRYKSVEGYHDVPPPYTGTFMPLKPDLVFHNAPTANETVSSILNVEASPIKPNKDLSQSNRPSAPIIEDWVFDSKDESEGEPMPTQKAPSFVQTSKYVKTPRPSVKPVEHPIPAENLQKDIPKSRGLRHRRNRKACFVCKSLTHLIKDCDYYDMKMVQKPVRNHAMRGHHQHYAKMTHPHPHRHVVPTTILTRSRLVPLTAARPVTTDVPQTKVQHQRPSKHDVTKAHSPKRRPLTLDHHLHIVIFIKKLLLFRLPKLMLFRVSRETGCRVTILNTLDPLGKFDGKADEGFLVGYSVSSNAFKVLNGRTIIIQETLHIDFLENQPNVAGSRPAWLFDIDTLTQSMNYQSVVAGNQPNSSTGIQEHFDAGTAGEGNVQQYVLFLLWSTGSKDPQNTDVDTTFEVKEPESEVHVSPRSSAKTKKHDDKTKREDKGKSPIELSTGVRNLSEEFEYFFDNSTNEVNAASTPVPVVGQNLTNNTNTFSTVDMPALEDITYSDDEEDVGAHDDFSNLETHITVSPIPTTRVHKDHHVTQIIGDLSLAPQTRIMTRMVKEQGGLTQINNDDFQTFMFVCFLSQEEPKRVHQALKDPSWIEAMQEELLQFKMQKVWVLVDLPKGKRDIGLKWVFRNKKVERGIVVRNKARLVAQGHTQEEGIDYEEVFAPVARIEAIRLFLAYASFMEFMVYQMDVKSAFLYRTIKEEVYVCQPPEFEDPDYHDKVYKVVKALYGLHQAPRAWFETLANYLLENGFQMGKIDQTLFIKKQNDGKSASTPIDSEKPLLNDPDGEDVDVHTYRYLKGKPYLGLWYPKDSPYNLVAYSYSDYVGASLDRKSTTGGYQFLGYGLISWQCKKQTVVATSSTDAEYVVAASCCAQVLWIQNQLLDYSPDQMVSGKDSSNPLMADNLPKIVWYSTHHVAPMKSWIVQEQTALGQTYALVVNPTIYVSCIKQFWSSVSIKKTNVVVRLQALIDKRKVIITEASVRQALRLYDAESVDCFPNEEIFAKLARMGYEKPSTKLTFYKASSMALAVICLATGLQVNDDVADVVADADAEPTPSSPTPATTPPHQQEIILSPSQVASTPPPSPHQYPIAQPSSPPQQPPSHDAAISMDLLNQLLKTCATLTKKEDASKQGGKIAKIDADEDVTLEEVDAEKNAKNEVIEQVKRKEKQDNVVMRYQALKRKPQTEAQARKNMMVYLKNMVGFKMDFFKEEEASKQSKRKSETSEEKAAKRQKLDEEVEELKTHLQIIPNDEDDVYTEATPLALKLFLSFISLLRNFDREDLEMLWIIVQERFASLEPKNFSDDFLLNALKTMFEKPNVEAHIWKNQRGTYGLAKVKSWKAVSWTRTAECIKWEYFAKLFDKTPIELSSTKAERQSSWYTPSNEFFMWYVPRSPPVSIGGLYGEYLNKRSALRTAKQKEIDKSKRDTSEDEPDNKDDISPKEDDGDVYCCDINGNVSQCFIPANILVEKCDCEYYKYTYSSMHEDEIISLADQRQQDDISKMAEDSKKKIKLDIVIFRLMIIQNTYWCVRLHWLHTSFSDERAEVYYECMEPFKSLMRLWVGNKSIVSIWLEKVVMPLIDPAIKGFAAAPDVLKPERLKVEKTWHE